MGIRLISTRWPLDGTENALPTVAPPTREPKLSFWQFRLREILLATIAVGALLVVVLDNLRPSGPSPIYVRMHIDQLVRNIATDRGLTKVSKAALFGEADFERTTSCDYAIPIAMRNQIRRDLRTALQRIITDNGGTELGTGSAGDIICLRYKWEKKEGLIYVAFFSVSPDVWQVNSAVVEMRQ